MCRLLTPELEKALSDYPLYSQDDKKDEAICCAIFYIGSARWYIIEGEREGKDVIMFGIVIGLIDDEYGYISLNELSEIEIDLTSRGLGNGKVQISHIPNFKPTPLKNINDPKLKEFLARFKD